MAEFDIKKAQDARIESVKNLLRLANMCVEALAAEAFEIL